MPVSEQMPATALRFGRALGALSVNTPEDLTARPGQLKSFSPNGPWFPPPVPDQPQPRGSLRVWARGDMHHLR